MMMVVRFSVFALVCGAVLLLLHEHAIARGRPATAPSAAMQEAIRQLVAEAEARLKDPSRTLREKSNFFTAGQSTVPESELLETLSTRISRNGFVDAYVKWQLTSGLPTKVSEENLRLAFRAYRSAPELQRLPGTTPEEHQHLQKLLQGIEESDIPAINEKWRGRLDPVWQFNDVVIRYRDAFWVRLPLSADTFELVLTDAVQRTEAGLDTKKLIEGLVVMVRSWAIDGAPSAQLSRVANMFARLREQRGATVFTSVQWDTRKKRAVWKTETRRVNPKYNARAPDEDAFVMLVRELEGYANSPSGGLRLRDK